MLDFQDDNQSGTVVQIEKNPVIADSPTVLGIGRLAESDGEGCRSAAIGEKSQFSSESNGNVTVQPLQILFSILGQNDFASRHSQVTQDILKSEKLSVSRLLAGFGYILEVVGITCSQQVF